MVYVRDNNSDWALYDIVRDYQGSITHLVDDSDGTVVAEYSYDPWGRMRNPETLEIYTTVTAPELFLGRGYTGHEHLTWFGLINMNARLYDPALGRFLSPDPHVQAPDFSQNFNRYAYCLNNPLKYKDEDGKVFLFTLFNAIKDLFVNTFIKSWTQGINAWTDGSNWHSTVMAFKIDMGLYKGNFKQIVSRFTKEAPQMFLGYIVGSFINFFDGVKSVSYYDGATAIEHYTNDWGAFTLGGFINGEEGLQADPNNSLFQHEFGHYLQSQEMGWGYLSRVGIPSLMSAIRKDDNHDYQLFEQDANRRAFLYFNENVAGFYKTYAEKDAARGWNYQSNPLDVNHIGKNSRGRYYDYNNEEHRLLLNRLTLNAYWCDYYSWHMGIVGVLGIGIANGLFYNNHRVR